MMPRHLFKGETVGNYRVVCQVAVGGSGVGYHAVSEDESSVFLKQVHSPGGRSSWFEAYVQYLEALFDRIRSTDAAMYCVDPIEVFVEKEGPKVHHRTLYEVFEFIDGSTTLGSLLSNAEAGSSPLTAAQRLTQAKVFMAAMSRVHEAGIVHCDLKPDNIQMLHDPSIEAGYRVKVIDIDRSLLGDRTPPWDSGTHDAVGYAFTPFYQSPEHLSKTMPTAASDVFTCGIMLHEIFGSGHPFRVGGDDVERYVESVLANSPPPLVLPEGVFSEEVVERVIEVVRRSLLCDPEARPTAREIHQTLLGRHSVETGEILDSERPEASLETYLVLEGQGGRSMRFNIDTPVGRANGTGLSDEHGFLSSPQFRLVRDGVEWRLVPLSDTKHATCLNGVPIEEPKPLTTGDLICVASRISGQQRCSLKVAIHARTDDA